MAYREGNRAEQAARYHEPDSLVEMITFADECSGKHPTLTFLPERPRFINGLAGIFIERRIT